VNSYLTFMIVWYVLASVISQWIVKNALWFVVSNATNRWKKSIQGVNALNVDPNKNSQKQIEIS